MSHQIKLRLSFLFVLLASATSFGAGFGHSNINREMFIANYVGLKNKLTTNIPLSEKINFIKIQDQAYLQMFQEMKTEVIRNAKLADHPDYRFAYELYDQYIPLLNLKLDESGKKLTGISCLESQSLVFTKDRDLPVEDGEDIVLNPESMTTAELLKKLCN